MSRELTSWFSLKFRSQAHVHQINLCRVAQYGTGLDDALHRLFMSTWGPSHTYHTNHHRKFGELSCTCTITANCCQQWLVAAPPRLVMFTNTGLAWNSLWPISRKHERVWGYNLGQASSCDQRLPPAPGQSRRYIPNGYISESIVTWTSFTIQAYTNSDSNAISFASANCVLKSNSIQFFSSTLTFVFFRIIFKNLNHDK